eukprot:NODE_343_length_2064_cov_60.582344_g337_i0.p1 GENE.NODE_343_length_2064_cov_60.582344_g337_i0~~NODE_343_length_2064_cov_60.582344_g337_i0.p1  ORF type:complete len:579 (+),score=84.22 NODE_343_length_2064_cov_60.582344_g337_i0:72-1808(+)
MMIPAAALVLLVVHIAVIGGNTCKTAAGAESWALRSGYQEIELGTFSVQDRRKADDYSLAASCDCADRCQRDARCRRWAVVPRYLGNISLIKSTCDAPNEDWDSEFCGYSAKCHLKDNFLDLYTHSADNPGQTESTMTDGFLPMRTGALSCTRGYSMCADIHCCPDDGKHICNPVYGCLPTEDQVKVLSGFTDSPFTEPEFWVPLVITCTLVGVALFSRTCAAGITGFLNVQRPLWESDVVRFMLELASFIFIGVEFLQSFAIFATVNAGDFRKVSCQLYSIDAYDVNTSPVGRPTTCLIRVEHLVGQSFPTVVNHLGRYYMVYGQVFDSSWHVWFGYLSYVIFPIFMVTQLCFAAHRLYLGFMQGRGAQLLPEVRLYMFIMDLFYPCENGYMFEPVSRAWTAEFFETSGAGMDVNYMIIIFFYIIFQAAFLITLGYLRFQGNYDFLNLRRRETGIRFLAIPLVVFPLWFPVMVILSFIYKFLTPAGHASWRVWYYYIGAIVCWFIRKIFSIFDVRVPPEERQRQFAPVKRRPVSQGSVPTSMRDDVTMTDVDGDDLFATPNGTGKQLALVPNGTTKR